MGVYGDQIARLKLVREIAKSMDRDDLPESDVIQLHAMVLSVADQVGDLLAAIPMTFKQYTKHDLLHAKNLIDLMGRFIPAKTLKKLNGVELTVLVLVAMLHDFGMYVDEEEKQKIVDGEEFNELLDAMPEKRQAISDAEEARRPFAASVVRDAVLADFFRKLHPERAQLNIRKYLSGLRFREYDLTDDVSTICESHGWGVFETTDPRHPERTIEKLKTSDPIYGVPFNPQYVATCLRLADIMDFDRSRTPLALLRTITDVKSASEWKKHLQIRGWTITDRDVSFHAKCTHPEHYVAVMEFIDWIDAELRDCRRLMRKQERETAERYALNLPVAVDRFEVEMADPKYVAGAFRFELDYERIMKILMDKSLYPDPSLFLRELLQNSLDACRVRQAIAHSEQATTSYTPRITVWDYSSNTANPTVVFQDNGIGMSKSVIEKYFMRVGRSYYRSMEFEVERKRLRKEGVELEAMSQFGIGFLSCFMVADRVEIVTFSDHNEAFNILIEGPTKYFTIRVIDAPARPRFRIQGTTREEDGPPVYVGTRIVIHLRPDVRVNVSEALNRFAANVDFGVEIVAPTTEIAVTPLRWQREWPSLKDKEEALAHRPMSELIEGGMAELLTPLFVPIDQYDFCDGLHGKLWFWMLCGEDGIPVPRLGNLRIGPEIEVSGLPMLVSRVRLVNHAVHTLLDDEGFREPSSPLLSTFNDQFRSLSADRRASILQWLQRPIDKADWYTVKGLPRALALDDWSWTEHSCRFDNIELPLFGPERLALYGIDLPAGITEWNPMAGDGRRIQLPEGSACWIDVRTRVPVPAASRLFVDSVAGSRIGIPLYRALLRFGLHKLQGEPDAVWVEWFDHFLDRIKYDISFGFWPEVLRLEHSVIREVLQVELFDGGTIRQTTLEEARKIFGQWAPIHPFGASVPTQGVWPTGRSLCALFGHPVRTNSDTKEVDLDSYTGEPFDWD